MATTLVVLVGVIVSYATGKNMKRLDTRNYQSMMMYYLDTLFEKPIHSTELQTF